MEPDDTAAIGVARMCLAVPGRIEQIIEESPLRMGLCSFGGVRRQICLEHVPQAMPGDYVLVHVGFALSIIDEAEAQRIFALLDELSALDESDEEPPVTSHRPR